ncbi:MAG: hypothetical protein SVK08_00735 [Halobacteriota archaeon]|nr:hypothetical protein [Halobacteriota archaeon]
MNKTKSDKYWDRANRAMSKYLNKRTWSELCNRWFDSKVEAQRGEELWLLHQQGEIQGLQYQVRIILSSKPRVSITLDYAYLERIHNSWYMIYEDAKGIDKTGKPIIRPDFRVKLAWLKQLYGIDVLITDYGYITRQ